MSVELEPFRVAAPDSLLGDLGDRLGRTRLSAQIEGSGWDLGTDRDYLEQLVQYWRDRYDWRRCEARINAFTQFVATIDGAKVHFIHARSPERDALPLLLTHGWPGSIIEFLDILGPLTDPARYGGDPAEAFHVVCPSIPGFGFSGPTTERGWGARRVAATFAELMSSLGYHRYGAQGGDFGSTISTWLALVDSEHMSGLHLNRVGVLPPPGLDEAHLPDDERRALEDHRVYRIYDAGYRKIQETRPQTIGYALDDSPAGLAAWIVEKFRSWSDCDGEIERRFSKELLLDNIMVYWVTATAHSAGRIYYETLVEGRPFDRGEYVTVPTAAAMFPHEIIRTPRRWAEAHYNIVRWTDMPRGGHFAALEEGALLVDDIRAFFRELHERGDQK